MEIKLTFNRSSAVSVRAALAMLNMPSPATLLEGSAIRLQVILPNEDDAPPSRQSSSRMGSNISGDQRSDDSDSSDDDDDDDDNDDSPSRWVGETEAAVMYYRRTWSLQSVNNTTDYEEGEVRFSLVCDPQYELGYRYVYGRRRRTVPPIHIGLPRDILNGPLSTYDLG